MKGKDLIHVEARRILRLRGRTDADKAARPHGLAAYEGAPIT
jgi:hypothetical protein